jgi:hypothetical protein
MEVPALVMDLENFSVDRLASLALRWTWRKPREIRFAIGVSRSMPTNRNVTALAMRSYFMEAFIWAAIFSATSESLTTSSRGIPRSSL